MYKQPFISSVCISRNDDYSDNLAKRMTLALASHIHAFDEVVYVDWNTDFGKPTMDDVIRERLVPIVGKNISKLRTIVVTAEQVRSMQLPSDAQDCCEVLARNVGIRRALGDYIVSTNCDIMYPVFNRNNLNPETLIASPRFEIDSLEFVDRLYDSILSESDLLNIQRWFVENQKQFRRQEQCHDAYSRIICCGDCQVAHRNLWFDIRGFEESMVYRIGADSNVMMKAVAHNFKVNVEFANIVPLHLYHVTSSYLAKTSSQRHNDPVFWNELRKTANADSWGFANMEFETKIG
jgi:hypothetical protein